MGNNLVVANTGTRGAKPSDERYTPPWFIERVDRFYGFGNWFDPCPASHGLPHKFDGLALDWTGRQLFINPPFSYVTPWAAKLLATSDVECVFLCPASHAGWHQSLAELQRVEVEKRIAFVFPDGVIRNNPPMDCDVFYKGPRPFTFSQHFGDLGRIVHASPIDHTRRRRIRAELDTLDSAGITRYVTRYDVLRNASVTSGVTDRW